ncbi:hypothetical protein BGZ83_000200, partial [Gryganskiella cystojenkinii]
PSLNPDSNQLRQDVVIFNRWKIANHQYNIGDVVSYKRPDEPNRIVVKRIVALEGDVVRTRKPYPDRQIRVPAGHCWVEGDELFHSTDSNHYGPVPLGLLQRKAEYIIYPFNRIGKIPEKPRTSRVHYAPGHKIYNRLDDIEE